MSIRRLLLGAAAASATVMLSAPLPFVQAFNPQPDPPKLFGMVGLVRGQRIRLNATNVTGGPVGLPAGQGRVTLGFLGEKGQLLGEPLQKLLDPGSSAFLELSFDELPAAATAGRAYVRPFVLSARERHLPLDPCRVTLEVIDDETGKTTVLLAAPPARH